MRPAFSKIALRSGSDTFAREWQGLAIAPLSSDIACRLPSCNIRRVRTSRFRPPGAHFREKCGLGDCTRELRLEGVLLLLQKLLERLGALPG